MDQTKNLKANGFNMIDIENLDKSYDIIIIGAGLSGIVSAQQLSYLMNRRVLLVESRSHIGGNCYTQNIEGIDVHQYGSHIFHTNIDKVWNYVNRFAEFNNYQHKVVASTDEETVFLPFSMATFMQLFNLQTVDAVQRKIRQEIVEWKIKNNIQLSKEWQPTNFEEQAISMVGTTVYEKLIKHYTEKQWGRNAYELPAEIIKRLPLRWNTDTTYFNNAKYQGIPVDGYTQMMLGMLADQKHNIDIMLNTDFIEHHDLIMSKLNHQGLFIYTGPVDRLMNYQLGHLEYRSLEFDHQILGLDNYQGTAVVNYTGRSKSITRITEHKHYSTDPKILSLPITVISSETSVDYVPEKNIPYYPIGDSKNKALHEQYKELFHHKYPNSYLLGRLADYKYYDMDKTIDSALEFVKDIVYNRKHE